jgi:hypothetical protein
VVHVASSQRLRGCEAKDGQFDGVGCVALEIRPNHHSLDVIFLLSHRSILAFRHHSPTPSYSCFLRGVGMLHGVRKERRESERSLQCSK